MSLLKKEELLVGFSCAFNYYYYYLVFAFCFYLLGTLCLICGFALQILINCMEMHESVIALLLFVNFFRRGYELAD